MRIDALPVTHVPQIVRNLVSDENPSDYQTRINCVLRFPPSPQGDTIVVEVNGIPKEGLQEGQDFVVSWQFGCGSDIVTITRRRGEAIVSSWQGCWNERDALLGMGSFDPQIYFNGKKQAPHLARVLASLPLPAPHVNENVTEEAECVPEDGVPGEGEQASGVQAQDLKVVVQEPLVRPEFVPRVEARSQVPQLAADALDEEPQEPSIEAREDEEEGRMEQGESPNPATSAYDVISVPIMKQGECPIPAPHDGIVDDVAIMAFTPPSPQGQEAPEGRGIPGEGGASENARSLSPDTGEVEKRPEEQATHLSGSQVWVFYADPAREQARYDALMALLAQLPPKSLVVDLRPGSRPRGRQQQNAPLAREHLRASLGGKYANMSQDITVASGVPTSHKPNQSARQGSRIASVTDLEGDGMQRLGHYLRDGYTIVLLDSEARYQESARYAVAQALQADYGCAIRRGEE